MPGPNSQRLLNNNRNPSGQMPDKFDPQFYYEESRLIGYDFCLVGQQDGEMTIAESFPPNIDAVAERRGELQHYLEGTPGAQRLLACYLEQIGRVGHGQD